MCGIVAVIDPTGRIDEACLVAMRDRLVHRGPDGAGAWIERSDGASVALGHRRLAILDLTAAGAQPMRSSDGAAVVVYNGEIYNHVELKDELRARGHAFHTRSDTEVLLAAYAAWGPDCVRRFNGMFAFALWDRRAKQLLIARDRFGEKPLFLTALPGGGVALASEMKALFGHRDVEVQVDVEVAERLCTSAYREADAVTPFRGVSRFPAAHAAVFGPDGVEQRRWRYWTPVFDPVERRSPADHVDRFRELMERSVRARLRADVAVGTSLSGGLDSSFLVGLIARQRAASDARQHTFSARFDDDPTISEGPHIDLVVRATGVESHAIRPDPKDLVKSSSLLHWHQEEPFQSASIFAQWCVARLAREHGITVLLDGQGADELLGGYAPNFIDRQLDLLDQRRWLTLAADTLRRRIRMHVAALGYSEPSRRFSDPALGGRALLSRALAHRPLAAPSWTEGLPPAAAGDRLRRQRAVALQYESLPTLLRFADRNYMAFGREGRLPFLDHDLVDFCLGLSSDALMAGGWQKLVLRRASEGVLPPAIQWRADKVGFAAPLDRWLQGPLASWARERVFEGPITRLASYRRAEVEALWRDHQAGTRNTSWALWRWISLNEWLALAASGAWRRGAPAPASAL